jgi:predicted PurR-regulated permease PerM
VVGGLLAWLGFAIVQQVQVLIGFLLNFIEVSLPSLAVQLSTNVYEIGPFSLDLTQFDLPALSEQVLGTLQPLLVQSGALISGFAASAVSTLGWLLFILVISYFFLAEAGQVPNRMVHIDIPGYEGDIRRLGNELQRIWGAFQRGQLIIFILSTILTLTLMSVLGLRLALAVAILAGVAKFVPYLGQFILLV